MGIVYLAEHQALQREVALKILPPALDGDSEFLKRFRREASAAARLHHTNIVPVYGMGEEAIIEIARRLNTGQTVRDLRDLRGVAYALGASKTPPDP